MHGKNSVRPNQRQTCPFMVLREKKSGRKARDKKDKHKKEKECRQTGVSVVVVFKRKISDYSFGSNEWKGGVETISLVVGKLIKMTAATAKVPG